jgi:hypothetical protein
LGSAELRSVHRRLRARGRFTGRQYGVCDCYDYEDMWACNVALEERGVFKLADRLGAARYN